MKRHVLLATMVAVGLMMASAVNAQEQKSLRYGIEVGGVVSNYTDAAWLDGYGFYAGVRGLYSFDKNTYAAASLRYIQKGSDGIDGDADGNVTYTPGYIELPVAIGMQGWVGKRTALFGETGPYVAYGVCGKDKGESYYGGPDGNKSWDRDFFSKASGSPRRMDWGWHGKVGVRFKHLELSVQYEHGLLSVWKNDDSKNTAWTFGLSYLL